MTQNLPLPASLFDAAQVREIDRIALEEQGINGFELMLKAAQFSFQILNTRWPDTKEIRVLCGSGNNAGDGYLIAALARESGYQVDVLYLSPPEKLTGDALLAYQYSQQHKVKCLPFSARNWRKLASNLNLVIVDAMLGTGLNAEVRYNYKEAIELCNNSALPVIAVDIPSGLSANTGQALGAAVEADCTATFIGLKLGLFTGSGRKHCGDLYYDDLGVPEEIIQRVMPKAERLSLTSLLKSVPPRSADCHKGLCGHVLLIGGDHGYGGAITLSAEAAARMGAGLVTVATQAEHLPAILARRPEVMVKAVSNIGQLTPLLESASVIVVGPGLGQSAWSQQMLFTALSYHLPTVLDADALNLISQHPDWCPKNRKHLVLTPHPGEAARLLKCSTAEIQADRYAAVQRLQQQWGGSVLLKGSGSLIAHASDAVKLCAYGNPGMASGGMGDVLSGMLGGLLGQQLGNRFAIDLAVSLHGKAADIAAEQSGQRGLLAGDLIALARALLNDCATDKAVLR